MMYRIFKAGTYLADLHEYWNVWIDDVKKSKPFYDKALADSIAETLEAQVIPETLLN